MSIVLEDITKHYGGHLIVDHISLKVPDGEFFVLLGASGSGKSTILRMVAGLASPDAGRILLHGTDVTYLPPQHRGVGFVFQNYSIFRHMSVADNIEFGLKIRKAPASERAARREELLDMVGLAGLGKRFVNQLSGGQQQRVALARALAYKPDVLLLDEPFGALDVRIRSQLRRSLKQIQRKLKVTAILVTHDQEEAFELADRIGILDRGRLLEAGPGESLYSRPKTLFAATFLGAGTVLVGRARSDRAHFGTLSLPIPDEVPHDEGARVQLLFRPEQVALTPEAPEPGAAVLGRGTIIEQNYTGASRRVRLRMPRLQGTRQIAPALPFGEESLLVDAVVGADEPLDSNHFWASLTGWHILQQPPARLMVFDSGAGPIAPLNLARILAEPMNASATLLAVSRDPDSAGKLRDALSRRQQEANLPVADLRVRHGNPAGQILAEQAETVYEMVLMAPVIRKRALPDIRKDGLGATVLKVLRKTDVPVLVVKGERQAISRILICTAAGEPGKSDVRIGGRVARRTGASVSLLYVTAERGGPGPLARAHLENAAATLRALEVNSEVLIRHAPTPTEGVLTEARRGDYDIIVVGIHRPRSRRILRTSDFMKQIVAGADRPVLVVPQ